jgi:D-sedoheptulose 7-phosphate isomerase
MSGAARWGECPREPGVDWRALLRQCPRNQGSDKALPSNTIPARADARPADSLAKLCHCPKRAELYSFDYVCHSSCQNLTMTTFAQQFLEEVQQVTSQLHPEAIEKAVDELARIRERGGRLFILGVGGSAANASHAVNDFRKICGFECYAPTDNVSELTARTNDEGWASVFVEWLKGSRLNGRDGLLIFSVGGGNIEKNVSPNLVSAVQLAKQTGAAIVGVVGRDGGYTAREASACVIVPTVNPDHVTPHSEAFQAVLWHLFVSHPKLKVAGTKWESTK